ncbi:MAG: TIGR00730 family Rossman fold protein, partial [Chitinophagaceae bacterium]
MAIQSLAVFCGSKDGNSKIYIEHAKELGLLFVKKQITLVYGGGSVGIMGAIADEVMNNGGKVIGVIPTVLVSWERQHKALSELIVVDDMHIRKKKMYDLCDAAVILAGGKAEGCEQILVRDCRLSTLGEMISGLAHEIN